MNKIKICGVPYKVKEVDVIDEGLGGIAQGKIIYSKATILLKRKLPKKLKKQTLFHEVLHGMLVQLGYTDQSEDETFVQALSTAMFQAFKLKNER